MTRRERYSRFIDYFSAAMPDVTTELQHEDPYELLVATILSAQCTDKRVNMTTPAFFRKYPNPSRLAKAKREDVFRLIRSISYPNNKTGHLIGMAKMLVKRFGSRVPSTVEELVTLPGVGRKTASVIASTVFHRPALAVDTHVFRVAARIGLTREAKTPLQAERQLVQHIPLDMIRHAHHWLILHGRYVCKARKPACGSCALSGFCKYFKEKNRKEKFP